MGYNIGIGEATIEYYQKEEYISIDVESVKIDNAPDLGKGDISGKGNWRYPSYTAMREFTDETGLSDVFYDEDNRRFKGGHPGATPITWEMYNKVKAALDKYKINNPNAIIPTPENTKDLDPFAEDNEHDYTLGRLVWFEFWFKWALENCKRPTMVNS